MYIFLVGHPHPILFCAYAHFFRLDAGAFRLFSTWDDTASVTQFHPHETPLKFFTNENMCTSTRSESERMEKRPLPATIIVYENWEHLENFSIILQTLNARFKHMFAHFCTEMLSYGKHDNRRFSLCNYIYGNGHWNFIAFLIYSACNKYNNFIVLIVQQYWKMAPIFSAGQKWAISMKWGGISWMKLNWPVNWKLPKNLFEWFYSIRLCSWKLNERDLFSILEKIDKIIESTYSAVVNEWALLPQLITIN